MATKIADITVSKQTGTRLTINAKGKYVEDDSYFDIAVQQGSATTPATSITANPTITVGNDGLITATVGKNQTVTPTVSAGYVSSGTSGTISVSGSNTNQLDTVGATTYHATTADTVIDTPAVVQTFNDGADNEPISLNVRLDPVQSLNGYDRPWVGGAGKNVFGPNTVPIIGKFINSAGGQGNADDWAISDYIAVLPNTQYFFNPNTTAGASAKAACYDSSKYFIGTSTGIFTSGPITFTTPENCYYMRFSYRTSSYDIQLEAGGSATSYEPYSNICPITGHTDVELFRTGFNVCDCNFVSGSINPGTGNNQSDSDKLRTTFQAIIPSEKYYCKSSAAVYAFFYDKDKTYLGYHGSTIRNSAFIPQNLSNAKAGGGSFSKARYVRFRYDSSTYTVGAFCLSFYGDGTRTGDSDISHIDTYDVSIPSSAGTVYGCTFKVYKDGAGTLTVDSKEFILDGDETLTRGVGTPSVVAFGYTLGTYGTYINGKVICDQLVQGVVNSTNAEYGRINVINSNGYSADRANFAIPGVTTSEGMAEYLAQHNLQFIAYYNNPITYHLSPAQCAQIMSLEGINNIWCADEGQTITNVRYTSSSLADQVIIEPSIFTTGQQKLDRITTKNINPSSIKTGVTIKVGDTADDDSIENVTGNFTDPSTVSSGQVAATAADIKSGKSAWVNGLEVQGTVANTSISEGTTTVSGSSATRGTATWSDGYISSGEMPAATFANEGTSGKTYVNISDTTSAPVLVAGDYLYINKGYTDDLKISLARLVPDGSDVKGHGEYIILGHSAYDNDGTLVAGSIPTLKATDVSVSGKKVTIPVGFYTGASGTTGISKSVADGAYSASVSNHAISTTPVVTGSVTGTISSIYKTSQPSGTDGTDYWTITPSGTVTTTGVSTASATATIGTAGYIAAGSKTVAGGQVYITPTVDNGDNRYIVKGTATQNAPTVDASGLVTATSTITAGYQKASTPSNTLQLSTQAGKTVTPTESEQTAVASGKYTTGVVKVGAISSTYVGSGIAQNDSDDLTVSDNVVTAPAGYYQVQASKSLALATVVSGTATISSLNFATGSDAASFSITGSASVSAPTVSVAGYISSTKGTKNAKTAGATVSTTVYKIVGSASILETKRKPAITKQDVPSGVTQAASGNATTTAPSSGVYVAVKSAENVTSLTPSINITTSGYGTNSKHGIDGIPSNVGAAASDTTYIPITTATPAFDGGALSGNSTATGTNVTLSDTDNGIKIQTAYTASRADVLYNGAVSGWVTKANDAVALAGQNKASTNGTAYYINDVTLTAPSSDTRTFSVVAPDKNSTNHTYLYTTDSTGNTSIKVDTTLTMQWNETDQSLDFVFT